MSQKTGTDFATVVEMLAGDAGESEPDFASEHSSLTFAYQLDGGPERARDPDSPKGLAGADDRFGSLLNG